MTTENKEFYLVALPGLEDLVQAEVTDWFPQLQTKVEHGGVSVMAPMEIGLALNLALKTPTRILVRVAQFRCRDFPKLFKKVAELPWEQWVNPSLTCEVHASATRSRLKIKSRIEETVTKAWAEHQKSRRLKSTSQQSVGLYVRLSDDECTISLDTSGERLHKRGLKTKIGTAPLRETIAAGLLLRLGRGTPATPVEIVDPMTGSGTFLIEALMRDRLIDSREFAFAGFAAGETAVTPHLQTARAAVAGVIGFEIDAKSLHAAKANLKACASPTQIQLFQQDIFTAKPLPTAVHPRWVMANPPYGERLKVRGSLAQYYAELLAATERVVRPERACFIFPSKAISGKLPLPSGWKVIEKRKFLNGGIPVTAFLFRAERSQD